MFVVDLLVVVQVTAFAVKLGFYPSSL